jgi:hypothetical protein
MHPDSIPGFGWGFFVCAVCSSSPQNLRSSLALTQTLQNFDLYLVIFRIRRESYEEEIGRCTLIQSLASAGDFLFVTNSAE